MCFMNQILCFPRYLPNRVGAIHSVSVEWVTANLCCSLSAAAAAVVVGPSLYESAGPIPTRHPVAEAAGSHGVSEGIEMHARLRVAQRVGGLVFRGHIHCGRSCRCHNRHGCSVSQIFQAFHSCILRQCHPGQVRGVPLQRSYSVHGRGGECHEDCVVDSAVARLVI